MQIIFLGTSCMIPTKERNHISILIRDKEENMLFDCGENTQRQLRIADISATKITRIFISHWHSDHILGLPGLLQSMATQNYNKTLKIYGPEGSKKFVSQILEIFIPRIKIKIEINEIKKDGPFLTEKNFSVEAYKLNHGNIPCLAYNLKEENIRKIDIKFIKKIGIPQGPLLGKLQKGENIKFKEKTISFEKATTIKKGKKLSIILDTLPTKNCIIVAKNSDILICESTFSEDHKDKAKEHKHLTAKQAAIIAKKANVKKLVLTHFSQRYKTTKEIRKEAKKIFSNTICSKDFMELKL